MQVERRQRERRGQRERRERERRTSPLSAVDVTRIEHENLYGQVTELLRLVRRMEAEVENQRLRLERLESTPEGLTARRG